MTTTDEAAAGRADRLAHLRERRAGETDTVVEPSPEDSEVSRRRRSPATTAKIVTVGASTTAVLGMMAGFGMAEGAVAMKPSFEDPVPAPAADSGVAAGDITAATPATTTPATTAPASTAPPQVIVVVIDGATGLPIDPTGLAEAGAIEVSPADSVPPGTTAVVPSTAPATVPAVAPAPVAVPVAVDLAVPKPPPPPAAPAPASQPAPQPQADSGGS